MSGEQIYYTRQSIKRFVRRGWEFNDKPQGLVYSGIRYAHRHTHTVGALGNNDDLHMTNRCSVVKWCMQTLWLIKIILVA